MSRSPASLTELQAAPETRPDRARFAHRLTWPARRGSEIAQRKAVCQPGFRAVKTPQARAWRGLVLEAVEQLSRVHFQPPCEAEDGRQTRLPVSSLHSAYRGGVDVSRTAEAVL